MYAKNGNDQLGDAPRDGGDVSHFTLTLLQKIEELTLYTIAQDRVLREQSERLEALEVLLDAVSCERGVSC